MHTCTDEESKRKSILLQLMRQLTSLSFTSKKELLWTAVCASTHDSLSVVYACGGARTTCRDQFSPSITQVPWSDSVVSGLVTSTFTHRDISPAHVLMFNSQMISYSNRSDTQSLSIQHHLVLQNPPTWFPTTSLHQSNCPFHCLPTKNTGRKKSKQNFSRYKISCLNNRNKG